MLRTPWTWALISGAVILCLIVAGGWPARADDPPAKAAPPTVDSAKLVAEALKDFKKAFAARGLKRDDKLAARIQSLRVLSRVQHPKVVDILAEHAKDSNADLGTGALLFLRSQKALPGYAGKRVLKLIKRPRADETFVVAGLEVIRDLGYLGGQELLAALITSEKYAIAKNALSTIGALRDVRLIDAIIKLIEDRDIEPGAKWTGKEGEVNSGAAGGHDQETADAEAAKLRGRGRGGGSQQPTVTRDLGPAVFKALHDLTGQKFESRKDLSQWIAVNTKAVATAAAAKEKQAKAQETAALALK